MTKIRELRVTDIRCSHPRCGAGPGEYCASPRIHVSRIEEHAALVAAGWQWQEVDPRDAGRTNRGEE